MKTPVKLHYRQSKSHPEGKANVDEELFHFVTTCRSQIPQRPAATGTLATQQAVFSCHENSNQKGSKKKKKRNYIKSEEKKGSHSPAGC